MQQLLFNLYHAFSICFVKLYTLYVVLIACIFVLCTMQYAYACQSIYLLLLLIMKTNQLQVLIHFLKRELNLKSSEQNFLFNDFQHL